MDYPADIPIDAQQHITNFWETAKQEAEELKSDQSSFRTQDLPLARIKKIMKLDDDVRTMMISAEAPILFAKAAELFIRELTLRAWIHTDRNRRRTLQRNDISMAVSYGDTDQFDFLIDIVPRDEGRGHRRSQQQHTQSTLQHMAGTSLVQQQHQQVIPTQTLTVATTAAQPNHQTTVADDASMVKTETAAGHAGTTTLVADADGTLTTVTATGQPTVQFATVPGAMAAAAGGGGGGQQIQYVIQLPPGSAGMAGQPFQLQVLPQQFQTMSTDAVAAAVAQTGGTTLITAGGDPSAAGGGVQLLHMMNPQQQQASTVHVTQPITTTTMANAVDAANKLQTVHVQAPTLLMQPSGAVVVATSSADHNASSVGPQTLVSVDGGETYTTAQIFTSTAAAADQAAAAAASEDHVIHDAASASTAAVEHMEVPQKLEEPSTDV